MKLYTQQVGLIQHVIKIDTHMTLFYKYMLNVKYFFVDILFEKTLKSH